MIKEVKAGKELVDILRERIQMGQSKQIAFARRSISSRSIIS